MHHRQRVQDTPNLRTDLADRAGTDPRQRQKAQDLPHRPRRLAPHSVLSYRQYGCRLWRGPSTRSRRRPLQLPLRPQSLSPQEFERAFFDAPWFPLLAPALSANSTAPRRICHDFRNSCLRTGCCCGLSTGQEHGTMSACIWCVRHYCGTDPVRSGDRQVCGAGIVAKLSDALVPRDRMVPGHQWHSDDDQGIITADLIRGCAGSLRSPR